MVDIDKEDYPDPSFRMEAVYGAVDNCSCHSRQSEVTLHRALWPLPKNIVEFVKERVTIHWKQKNHVAILLTNDSKRPYTIVLDTKLENESMKVRVGVLSLKIAEAYLLENSSHKVTRKELATQWGVDSGIRERKHLGPDLLSLPRRAFPSSPPSLASTSTAPSRRVQASTSPLAQRLY